MFGKSWCDVSVLGSQVFGQASMESCGFGLETVGVPNIVKNRKIFLFKLFLRFFKKDSEYQRLNIKPYTQLDGVALLVIEPLPANSTTEQIQPSGHSPLKTFKKVKILTKKNLSTLSTPLGLSTF